MQARCWVALTIEGVLCLSGASGWLIPRLAAEASAFTIAQRAPSRVVPSISIFCVCRIGLSQSAMRLVKRGDDVAWRGGYLALTTPAWWLADRVTNAKPTTTRMVTGQSGNIYRILRKPRRVLLAADEGLVLGWRCLFFGRQELRS